MTAALVICRIVSVSSLIIGVAAATPESGAILIAGVAALMAGAM